jgi:transposase InsO family protein
MLMLQGRVVVPDVHNLKQKIMIEAHSTPYSVHPGSNKMYQDLRRTFWWRRMKTDVALFVARCQVCQQVRIEHQKPGGMTRSLPDPVWKWTDITMDFVTGLRRDVRGFDAIWVVVDRLTKTAHFIPIQETWPVSDLVRAFIQHIVRLHGVPERIVSDRDGRFTSRFWRQVHEALGSKLHFSTAYHPQTDGQSERTIQTLEDMLRACVLEWGNLWVRHLPLVEFSYNNSYHSSIRMAPFEALYRR